MTAVAVGADQYSGGGLQTVEYSCKYNRLVEIARENDELNTQAKLPPVTPRGPCGDVQYKYLVHSVYMRTPHRE